MVRGGRGSAQDRRHGLLQRPWGTGSHACTDAAHRQSLSRRRKRLAGTLPRLEKGLRNLPINRSNEPPAETRELSADRITRRVFAQRAAALGLAVPTLSGALAACGGDDGGGEAAKGTVNFVSYGGSYNENLQKSIIDPFQKESGIDVKLGVNTELAPVKLQVQSGNVEWDLVELTGGEYEIAADQGLLEPFDYDIIKTANVPDYAVKDFGIKYALFLFVMAWDETTVSGARTPASWSEFWDTDSLPGKRSLYDKIDSAGLLEAALMADGVPIGELFPLDVDRALASLDKLGRENIVFHAAPQQSIQQLSSHEVPLASSWNGRVGIAVRDANAKIGFTPKESVLLGDYLVVPKGAPNPEGAFELVNYIVNEPRAGAEYAQLTYYAIANKAALELLPPDFAAQLPTSPALEGKIAVKDDAWWAANLDSATEAFKQWQLSG